MNLKCSICFFVFLFVGCNTQKNAIKEKDDLISLFVEEANASFYSEKKGIIAANGMVASAHPVASKVGVDILKKGGNAFDAAVAVHFALAVVHPFAGNLGGGGFAVIRTKKGEKTCLDFREKAPLKASKDMYLDKQGNVIEGLSLIGHLASGVPGSVDGMYELHKKYGSLDWKICLEPAIELAMKGVVLTKRKALELNNYRETFQKVNGPENEYFVKNSPWQEGDLFVQEDLGKTLERIKISGRDGFYKGLTSDLLVKEMEKGGGIISQKDLDQYSSVWRTPIEINYRGYNVISMPPPSSGGIALGQILKLIEPYNLKELGFNSTMTTQIIVEAERRVYADRAKYLGDSDFIKIPIDTLLSKEYLRKRWSNFNFNKASKSADIEGGAIPGYESNETTHFTVVDNDGNAIAITTTLNGAFGSKVVVKKAGFLMNNEMDDFSIKPGVPNMFGLIGNKANAIEPGKRMLSSMTPTIIEKNNQLFMTVGTPGGSTIITSVLQTIVNVIDHGMNIQESVNALKFHHQWLPDKVIFEKNAFKVSTIKELRSKGYNLEEQKGTLGRMDCIEVLPEGTFMGGSDPRSDNTSIGY